MVIHRPATEGPGPAAAGPAAATLDQLAAAYGAEIGILAILVLQHRTDAETVVERSLVEAFRTRGLPATDPDRRLAVLRIAARQALDRERRSAAIDPVVIEPVPGLPGGAPAPPSVRGGIPPAALVVAMATLPARSRALIALRYALDLEARQIAAVIGSRPTRVAAELVDVRGRLQDVLEGGAPMGVIEEITDVD